MQITRTATELNTANTLVRRDASGNFAGGAFTGSVLGPALTAAALTTPRTINGVTFDGTGNITVAAEAGTLTGATLAATITASSLTSVGTLASLLVAGSVGIGTAPSTLLHLNGADPELRISGTGNTQTMLDLYNAATDGFSLRYVPSNAFTELKNYYQPTVSGQPYGNIGFAVYPNGGSVAATVLTVAGYTGNVGIGLLLPNAAALLDVASTTKGFLPPRMTTGQRDAISSPPAGLLIYNVSTGALNVFGAAAWEAITSS